LTDVGDIAAKEIRNKTHIANFILMRDIRL